MPIIIPTQINATIAGLTTISITPPPTPIPELWPGLQCWLSPDWVGSYLAGQYAVDHADAALASKYYVLLNDAASRLGALGSRNESLARRIATFSLASWFSQGITSGEMVNGRKTLAPSQIGGQAMYLSNEPGESEKAAALGSSTYTIALVYRADNGVKGGIIGSGLESLAESNSGTGWRFGWPDAGEAGSTLWQHNYNDTWSMAVDTANDLPSVAVLTGTGTAGKAWLKNNGAESSLTHTFSGSRVTASNKVAMGCLATAGSGNGNRRIALIAMWSRELTGTDLTTLKDWLIANYGPF